MSDCRVLLAFEVHVDDVCVVSSAPYLKALHCPATFVQSVLLHGYAFWYFLTAQATLEELHDFVVSPFLLCFLGVDVYYVAHQPVRPVAANDNALSSFLSMRITSSASSTMATCAEVKPRLLGLNRRSTLAVAICVSTRLLMPSSHMLEAMPTFLHCRWPLT